MRYLGISRRITKSDSNQGSNPHLDPSMRYPKKNLRRFENTWTRT